AKKVSPQVSTSVVARRCVARCSMCSTYAASRSHRPHASAWSRASRSSSSSAGTPRPSPRALNCWLSCSHPDSALVAAHRGAAALALIEQLIEQRELPQRPRRVATGELASSLLLQQR